MYGNFQQDGLRSEIYFILVDFQFRNEMLEMPIFKTSNVYRGLEMTGDFECPDHVLDPMRNYEF